MDGWQNRSPSAFGSDDLKIQTKSIFICKGIQVYYCDPIFPNMVIQSAVVSYIHMSVYINDQAALTDMII